MIESSAENLRHVENVYPIREIILPTAEEASEYVADAIENLIVQKPHAAITLPTGNTPLYMFDVLGKKRREGLDCSGIKVYGLDEYWRIGRGDPVSFTQYFRKNVFSKINVLKEHRFMPDGQDIDPYAAARQYEKALSTAEIDLAVLGIGPNGHIGFNEPGSIRTSRTGLVRLTEETREANKAPFGDIRLVPRYAITQGIGNILEAKKIILLATGEAKADAVYKALREPIGPAVPASFVRYHPNVTFVMDEAAASRLRAA